LKDKFFVFGGVVSIGFYIALLIGLYFYLKDYHSKKYLSSGDKGVAISLASIPQKEVKKNTPIKKAQPPKKVLKPQTPKMQKPKPKPKKMEPKKPIVKKVAPKPKVTKKKPTPKPKPKSVDDLFSDIKTSKPKEKKKNFIKTTDKPTSSSKSSGQGKQQAYIKKIYSTLENGIPMDEKFAGSQVNVKLTIYNNGDFRFRIVRYDSNTEFNEMIIQYLEQLQSIGLDRHSSAKAYVFTVELIAKE